MKKILALLNIIVPIVMLVILLFSKLSENTVIIITLTIFVGWVIPYLISIITGIIILRDSHQRIAKITNFLNIILLIILIIFSFRIYDSRILLFVIQYSILLVLSVIDYIYLIVYLKKHPSDSAKEKAEIKEKKKKNNGAIV